jgi:hypothetical protein
MDGWKPASTVKGLFASPPPVIAPPLLARAVEPPPLRGSSESPLLPEETEVVPVAVESVGFVQKAKTMSTPAKVGIAAGALLLVLCMCLLPLILFLGRGGGPGGGGGGPGGLFGKTPPYADAGSKIVHKEKQETEELERKYGGSHRFNFEVPVHEQVQEKRKMWEKVKQEADPLLAAVDPLPISLDNTCDGVISNIEIGRPTYDANFGRVRFPVTYTAGKPIRGFITDLRVKVYDGGGAVIGDRTLFQDAAASAGERVSGHFLLSADEGLRRVSSYKVFSK